MLSPLFLKAKEQIHNIQNINFTSEQWNWYYEEGVVKKLEQLNKKERSVLEIYVRARRAKNLTKDHKILLNS